MEYRERAMGNELPWKSIKKLNKKHDFSIS